MKIALVFGLLAGMVLMSGCIDTDTHLNVNPDGTGTILLSVYLSAFCDIHKQFSQNNLQ